MLRFRVKVWARWIWCGVWGGHNWTPWYGMACGYEGGACEECGKVRYRKKGGKV